MSGLTTFDAIYIALIFIVPGYIFLTARNQFVVGQDKLGMEQVIAYVTLSGVNFALFGWVIYLAIANSVSLGLKLVLWTLVMIVLPGALGVISGHCSQRNLFRQLYSWFGFRPSHSVQRSWDYMFSKMDGQWILVTLKDGSKCGGWWAGSSFASADPKERDILIERQYRITDDSSPWTPLNRSILIAAGEVRTVEIIPDNEVAK